MHITEAPSRQENPFSLRWRIIRRVAALSASLALAACNLAPNASDDAHATTNSQQTVHLTNEATVYEQAGGTFARCGQTGNNDQISYFSYDNVTAPNGTTYGKIVNTLSYVPNRPGDNGCKGDNVWVPLSELSGIRG